MLHVLITVRSLSRQNTGRGPDARASRLASLNRKADEETTTHPATRDRSASSSSSDAARLMPDPARRFCSARRRQPRRAGLVDRVATSSTISAGERADANLRFQRSRAGLAVQSKQARADYSEAPSRVRFRSTPIIPRRTHPRSSGTNTSSWSAAWSTTRNPGASMSSTRCRRRRRSRATSASRAGAPSASGQGTPLREFPAPRSAPIRARNMSGSAAPKAIPPPSTCRPRCIRRRR